jgi:hypothetical protein
LERLRCWKELTGGDPHALLESGSL